MRLIDADAAKARLKPYSKDDEKWGVTGGTALRLIHNALDNSPTIDAVPVVRCKNCRHFHLNMENDPYCSQRDGLSDPTPDSFCSLGEREENANV